jgi:hypothetical protein
MNLGIRRLEPSDDRRRFTSVNPELDRFFQRFAGQNQFRHHVGVTYMAVAEDEDEDEDEDEEIGCVGVVDAKPEAQAFYSGYGFEPFAVLEGALLDRPQPTPMFLPLSAIPSSSRK